MPRFANACGRLFVVVEYAALTVFSSEYLVRVSTAAEHAPWRRLGAVRSRLHFVASPSGLIDLAAVLPFWMSFIVAADFKALYGDAITAAGRLVAGLTIFVGRLMVALPVGVVATAFANEVHRRDFVVTWSLVARISLFGELTAVQSDLVASELSA